MSFNEKTILQDIKLLMNKQSINIDKCDINWSDIYNISYEGRIRSLIYNLYSKYMPMEIKKIYNIERLNKINYLKLKIALNLIEILNNNEINYCVIKGFVLSNRIYNNPIMRNYNDIDLIIKSKNIMHIDEILKEMGFIIKTPIISEIHNNELELYEIKYQFSKLIDNEKIIFSLEVKLTSSAINKYNFKNFFENSTIQKINNTDINVLDQDHSLIHLILNTYWNLEDEFSKVCLRDCIDLYIFIMKDQENIIDSKFKYLIREYKIQNEVFAILSMLYSIFNDNKISEIILNLFDYNEIFDISINNWSGWKFNWNNDFLTLLTDKNLYSLEWYFRRSKRIYHRINKLNNVANKLILTDAYFNDKYNFKFNCYAEKSDQKLIFAIDFKSSNISDMNTKIIFFDIDYSIKEKSIEVFFDDEGKINYIANNVNSKIIRYVDRKVIFEIDSTSFKNYYTYKNIIFGFCAIKKFQNNCYFALLNNGRFFEDSKLNIINL